MRIALPSLCLLLLAGCVFDVESERTDEEVMAVHPRFSKPEGVDAAYPIVLAHGFNASPVAREGTPVRNWVFSDAIVGGLRADGHTVYVAHVRPYAGVAERAADLRGQIDEALKLLQVHDQWVGPGQPFQASFHVPRGATRLVVHMSPSDASLYVTREGEPEACTAVVEADGGRSCTFTAPGGSHYWIWADEELGSGASFDLDAKIDSKVNVIAHSMGGLDARYLISALGETRVASLTTISTPHAGSRVANEVLDATGGVDAELMNKLASWLGGDDPNLGSVDLRGALQALHLDTAAAFNRDHPEGAFEMGSAPWTAAANGVYYQSWAGVSSWLAIAGPHDAENCRDARDEEVIFRTSWLADTMDPLIAFAGAIVGDGQFISNDGLVSVQSAKWGDFQGCIPADHIDEIGQGLTTHTDFDAPRFYRTVVFALAAHGY